jgi:hypothetical protein
MFAGVSSMCAEGGCLFALMQVETRATGEERETGQRAHEHMGAQERVVEAAQPVMEQPTAEYFTKVRACVTEETLQRCH